MIENASKKGSNHPARRSELSSSWRKNVDTTAKDAINDPAESRDTPLSHDFLQKDNTKPTSGSPGKDTESQEALRGENDPDTLRAIAEGRRLYVGNMPYFAKVNDVQDLFEKGDYKVAHINMSIDPYTGRNPSYCFVEVETKEHADRAMQELNGINLLRRPVKIGPGVARSSTKHPRAQHDQGRQSRDRQAPIFNRWNRADAADHWTGYSDQGRRLWVGGLPHMDDHLAVNNGIRDLFRGFKVKPAFGEAGAWNHRYLFVDFPTAEEADRAAKATNGKQAWGVKIRVLPAKPRESRKIGERETWQQEQNAATAEGSSFSFRGDSDQS